MATWFTTSLRLRDEERELVRDWWRKDPNVNSFNDAIRAMIKRATEVGIAPVTEDGGVRPRKEGEHG